MFLQKRSNAKKNVQITVESIYHGHHNVTYRGVKAIRCPFDYLIYQMIITEIKPDLVIEIGTNVGGGALYIADLMELMGHGEIHTIDIRKQFDSVIEENPRIKLFTEGWEKYDIDQAKKFEKVLVIEDASHVYEDTLAAIRRFAPLVTKDSYLIVEDGIINELGMEQQYNGGPLKAIKEFLMHDEAFEIDRKWCDMFGINATFNVDGYLKRVK